MIERSLVFPFSPRQEVVYFTSCGIETFYEQNFILQIRNFLDSDLSPTLKKTLIVDLRTNTVINSGINGAFHTSAIAQKSRE